MICVIAAIETQPGRRDDLLAVFRDLAPVVRAEEGCIEYIPAIDVPSGIAGQAPVRPNVVTVVEKWESLAALEAHLKAPHMVEFRRKTEAYRVGVALQIVRPS